jgi:hypothetical protein
MRILSDYEGREIRLTDERLAHILGHPEMERMEPSIVETLRRPQSVIRSVSDDEARLYYRLYPDTVVGEKLLCVVVKAREDDAFVLTAYLTDKLKRGEVLWRAEEP